jgi:hypothetical protein
MAQRIGAALCELRIPIKVINEMRVLDIMLDLLKCVDDHLIQRIRACFGGFFPALLGFSGLQLSSRIIEKMSHTLNKFRQIHEF